MKYVYYRLTVTLSRSPRRLAADRALKRTVKLVGLQHRRLDEAEEAAVALCNCGALVTSVLLQRVEEEHLGVWRKGKRSSR
jgi:hypothetical protein